MTFPAFLDACVLYPNYLCDTLLRLAEVESYRPLWSADVLEELRRNLIKRGISPAKVDYRIEQMNMAFPDALTAGYEPHIETMTNHPKDRHVLAAAVHAHAEVIITFNIKDFPDSAVKPYAVTPIHPDDFLLNQLDLYPWITIEAVQLQASAYRQEPTTALGVLAMLEKTGLTRFATEARRHLPGSMLSSTSQ